MTGFMFGFWVGALGVGLPLGVLWARAALAHRRDRRARRRAIGELKMSVAGLMDVSDHISDAISGQEPWG